VPVFELDADAGGGDARQGVRRSKVEGVDTIIIDTAGRLQIDGELARIKPSNPMKRCWWWMP